MKVTVKLLDLFCCAGGASSGYHRAGFQVTGVDLHPQPRYPFRDFTQADAVEFPFDGFDAIHASPPCQAYSNAMKHLTKCKTCGELGNHPVHKHGFPSFSFHVFEPEYPMLLDVMLGRLKETAVPWVVENVPGSDLPVAPTLFGEQGLLLCGSMFGLRVQRHRLFQTSFELGPPGYCVHDESTLDPEEYSPELRAMLAKQGFKAKKEVMNPHNSGARKEWREKLGSLPIERTWRDEMGVGWMDSREGREAIPPVYTEYIGKHMMNVIRDAA